MSSFADDEDEVDMNLLGLPQAFGKVKAAAETKSIGRKRNEEDESRSEEEVKKSGNFACIGKRGQTVAKTRQEHNETNKTYVNDESEVYVIKEPGANAGIDKSIAKALKQSEEEEEEEDEKEETEEGEDERKKKVKLPIAYEVDIPAHEKTVSALDVTAKGSRMISGGLDCMVRLWDFNGMTMNMKNYRQVQPKEGIAIQALRYSENSSLFLCAIGGPICHIYNTDDAKQVQQTVQGDMYIRDTANTKGHSHMTTDCQWHPTNREIFITSALDATVRLWDMTSKPYGVDQALPSIQCLKAVDRRNLNISNCHVLCCEWTKGVSKCIMGGCVDGSIQIWNEKRNYGKPDKVIRDAHKADVTNLTFFSDNQRFLSRSMDDTMKLWDIRQTNKYVFEWKDLPAIQGKTNVCLSPSEDIILAPTQSDPKKPQGRLYMYDARTYDPIKSLDFGGVGIVRAMWPEALNQIVLACTNGKVKVLYDPEISVKGALLFVSRAASREQTDAGGMSKEIYTPDTLPKGYKETRTGLFVKVKPRGKEKLRIERETQKTIVPPRPSGKEGSGGIAGTGGNFSHYALKKFNPDAMAAIGEEEKDIVEALREQAKSSIGDEFITRVYKASQPQNILDYSMEQGEEEELFANTKKCPRCGLKLCQCGFMQLDDMKGPRFKQQRTK